MPREVWKLEEMGYARKSAAVCGGRNERSGCGGCGGAPQDPGQTIQPVARPHLPDYKGTNIRLSSMFTIKLSASSFSLLQEPKSVGSGRDAIKEIEVQLDLESWSKSHVESTTTVPFGSLQKYRNLFILQDSSPRTSTRSLVYRYIGHLAAEGGPVPVDRARSQQPQLVVIVRHDSGPGVRVLSVHIRHQLCWDRHGQHGDSESEKRHPEDGADPRQGGTELAGGLALDSADWWSHDRGPRAGVILVHFRHRIGWIRDVHDPADIQDVAVRAGQEERHHVRSGRLPCFGRGLVRNVELGEGPDGVSALKVACGGERLAVLHLMNGLGGMDAGTGPARGWRAQPTLTLMLSMPSLVTVNNNVSLLSIIITPSTYVATLTLSFVFVYLYIVQISWKPTLLPNINYFERTTAEAEPPKPQLLFLP
ncbi:hypothetical protein Landi51_13014 [Colletotrichum acutatum]